MFIMKDMVAMYMRSWLNGSPPPLSKGHHNVTGYGRLGKEDAISLMKIQSMSPAITRLSMMEMRSQMTLKTANKNSKEANIKTVSAMCRV